MLMLISIVFIGFVLVGLISYYNYIRYRQNRNYVII